MSSIITDAGLAILANRVKGLGAEPLYIGWGTGSTAPTALDTQLQTEDVSGGYTRATGTTSIVATSITGDTYQVSGSLTAQAPLVITEWAVFDAIGAGNMLCREVFAAGHSLGIGDALNLVFKFQDIRG